MKGKEAISSPSVYAKTDFIARAFKIRPTNSSIPAIRYPPPSYGPA